MMTMREELAVKCGMRDLLDSEIADLQKKIASIKPKFKVYTAKDISVQETGFPCTYRTSEGDVFECNRAVFDSIFKTVGNVYYPMCHRIKAAMSGDYLCIGEGGYMFVCPKQVFELMYAEENCDGRS